MSETDETGVTDNPMPAYKVGVLDRLDTLADSLATANRAAIANTNELRRLRHSLVFVGIFLTVLYWKGYI